jgi:hypothetical protein
VVNEVSGKIATAIFTASFVAAHYSTGPLIRGEKFLTFKLISGQ